MQKHGLCQVPGVPPPEGVYSRPGWWCSRGPGAGQVRGPDAQLMLEPVCSWLKPRPCPVPSK